MTPPSGGERDAEGKREAVATHAARLVLRHGIDGITHARLARAAGVSRPWLYKYIGRERADLVRFMANTFGLRLAELDNRPRLDRREHWIDDTVEGVAIMVRKASEAPWVLPLYFRYVGTENPIGDCIGELETRYLRTSRDEIARVFGVDEARALFLAELIHAARLGVVYRQVTAGFSREDAMEHVLLHFRGWLERTFG